MQYGVKNGRALNLTIDIGLYRYVTLKKNRKKIIGVNKVVFYAAVGDIKWYYCSS